MKHPLTFTGTSDTVKNAFIAAAQTYTDVALSDLNIATTNTGPAIQVRIINFANWNAQSGLTPCPDYWGCSDIPANGLPGARIWIPTRPPACGVSWTQSALSNIAHHELGHAVGFAHPKEAGSSVVTQNGNSTSACTKTPDVCLKTPGYPTVMNHYDMVTPQCTSSVPTLSSDDRVVTSILY